MKKVLLILTAFTLAAGYNVTAQTPSAQIEKFIKADSNETWPKFPGDLSIWLDKEMAFPEGVPSKQREGLMKACFVVKQDGSVTDIRIIESPDKLLSDELTRALSSSPLWSPGELDGAPADMRLYLAVDYGVRKKPVFYAYLLSLPDDSPMLVRDGVHTAPMSEMPRFNGRGLGEFSNWVFYKLISSNKVDAGGRSGHMTALMIVEKDGSVNDVKITESFNPSYDRELVNIVRSSPKWTPGMRAGVPVRVSFYVPVQIGLRK